MKKRHFLLILFLIPSLVYGLNQKECNKIQDQAIAEWNRHNELFQEFNSFGADPDGHGLHRLRESLYCCQRALSLIDTILNDIAGKSKEKRKEPWRVTMKEACEKTKKNINDEITQLEKGINNVLSSMAFDKAKTLYDESLKFADEASSKHKKCPARILSNVDAVVSALQEVAKLYRNAESLAKEAYTTLTSAPSYDEASKTALGQTVENFKQAAISIEKEAAEWPEKALAQKTSLKERLETLTEDSTLFEEKGLNRSSYELKKQALSVLETLIQNSEGEEKEALEKRLEGLKTSIALFEETADQNRLTQAIAPLSAQEFKNQEEARRESFFKSDFALDPSLFFKTFIYPTSRPSVIPLDGQIGKSQKEYILYLDQFYRFYLQSDNAVSKLIVKVYKQDALVHEEEISLPVKNTLSWRSYLLEGGLIFIPETKLEKEFGLGLRVQFVPDPRCQTSLILSQKASDPNYRFSFALDEGTTLYTCNLLEPLPWQLDALCKPSMQTPNRFIHKNDHSFAITFSQPLPDLQLFNHFSLLDEFVETHKKDPLALAAYVQNEISLVDTYCYLEEGVFQSSGIQRNALRVYLEGQGSPWEQCQLLIYLLRRAGYRALYAMGKPCSLPKDTIENMLFTRLPEGQEEGLLQYPWVVFFDGEKWVSLFPWMKEIQMSEGFNVYHFLPEEFASADRWILRYLKGDERILRHIIGPEGDDSAARLFVAFVEEHLREQGLSLDDVGIHRTQIKRQLSSFADFPSPKVEVPFKVFDLDENSEVFAKTHIEISSHESPEKKINAISPMTSILTEAVPLRFEGNHLHVHFIGEEKERVLELNETDRSIDIKVTPEILLGSKFVRSTKSVSLEKTAEAALCFHFGGATPKLTKHAFDRFNEEKEESKKVQHLLSFVGAAYFEKCGVAQNILAKLHKVHPLTDFAFGLAKLAQGGTKESHAKFPQVDMVFLGRPPLSSQDTFFSQEVYSALRQFEALTVVDTSSNEHQVLRDIFSNTSAISTVKLLQLAHQYRQKEGFSGEGFLALNAGLFKEAEENPETFQSLYFSHLNDLNLRDLHAGAQWNIARNVLGQEDFLNSFAYVYMTPGFVYSPDRTYKEMGTFIFHPTMGLALISSGSLSLNGGLGPPLPDYYFNPSAIPEWQLTPSYNGYMNSYKLEVPSRFDTSASVPSLPQTMPLEKTRWEPDVRIEHKSPKGFVADPVDVASGSFYIDETDLALPGPFPLEIRRNYNSQNPLMGQLGAGWKLSLNPFLVNQDGKLYAAESDGTIICYGYNSETSRWEVFPEDNPDLCNFNQKGIGSLASPFHAFIEDDVLYGADGSKRFFEDGLLCKWVNARGATLTFSYRDDQLHHIESSYGEFLRFEYNETGKISEIYAKDGRRLSYSYSSQGDLVKVILPNTASITYEYDHAHRIIRETKPHGKVLENVYKEGKVEKQYSPMGPQQQMILSATFDYQDGVTTVKDAKEGTTIYKIFQKQIYKIIDPLGAVTLQSWFIDEESWFDAKSETTQPWNESGAAVRSLKSTTDKRGLTISYLYDEKGNPIQVSLQGDDLTGDGQTTTVKKLKFNDHNLCIQEEVLEQKTITTFDKTFPYLPKRIEKYSNNHLLSYIDLEYNAQGLLKKENNNGAITRFQYDARGFPIQKTEETGTENPDVVTEYSYNAQGQCIKVVMEDGCETNVYDIMGNLIEAHRFSSIGQLLSSSYVGYNLNSQPIWQQTANAQNTTYFDYHSSGQIKAKRQQLAPSQKVAYTLFEYDPRGYLIEEVDPLGYTTYREHDALGNVLSETKEGHTTEFTYEAGGFVETITSPSGAKTTRHYTTNGLLKEEIYPDGTKASIIYDLFFSSYFRSQKRHYVGNPI